MDTFPDLNSLSDEELKHMIQELAEEEREVSYRRRLLHGRIDMLRAELDNRLRRDRGQRESPLSGSDVDGLSKILAGGGAQSDTEPR